MAATAPKLSPADERALLLQQLLWEDSARNVAVEVSADGKTATFTVDLTADLGLTTSGSSTSIAKTGASAPQIPGTDVKVNMSLYRVLPKDQRPPKPAKTTLKAV
jgi:hypothetical protein